MSHTDVVRALSDLVDQAGLPRVLAALSDVCMRRSDHWYGQPEGRGKALAWRSVARVLDALDDGGLPR